MRAGDRVLGRQVLRRAPRPLLLELELKPSRAVLRRTQLARHLVQVSLVRGPLLLPRHLKRAAHRGAPALELVQLGLQPSLLLQQDLDGYRLELLLRALSLRVSRTTYSVGRRGGPWPSRRTGRRSGASCRAARRCTACVSSPRYSKGTHWRQLACLTAATHAEKVKLSGVNRGRLMLCSSGDHGKPGEPGHRSIGRGSCRISDASLYYLAATHSDPSHIQFPSSLK